MKIDSCLILSAGLGTRMGIIGNNIPKVLWPIFELSMLDLQIKRARQLGCASIYINVYYLSSNVINHLEKNNQDVKIFIENELLGAGGSISFLKSNFKCAGKTLLVLNGDLFYFFPINYMTEALKLLENTKCVLFGKKVRRYYSKLILDNEYVKAIVRQNGLIAEDYVTYAGNCLVNLDRVPAFSGSASFFDSIAPYKTDPIPIVIPEKNEEEFWDFGTAHLYFLNMFSVLKISRSGQSSLFLDFLRENRCFENQGQINNNLCYGKTERSIHTINLSDVEVSGAVGAIFLPNTKSGNKNYVSPGIYFDQFQHILSL